MKKWYLVAALALLLMGCGDSDTLDTTVDTQDSTSDTVEWVEESEPEETSNWWDIYGGFSDESFIVSGQVVEADDSYDCDECDVSGDYFLFAMNSDIGCMLKCFGDYNVVPGDFLTMTVTPTSEYNVGCGIYNVDDRWCAVADVEVMDLEITDGSGSLVDTMYNTYMAPKDDLFRARYKNAVAITGEDSFLWTEDACGMVIGTLEEAEDTINQVYYLCTDDGSRYPVGGLDVMPYLADGNRIVAWVSLGQPIEEEEFYLNIVSFHTIEEVTEPLGVIEMEEDGKTVEYVGLSDKFTFDTSEYKYFDGMILTMENGYVYVAVDNSLGDVLECSDTLFDGYEEGDLVRIFTKNEYEFGGSIIVYEDRLVSTGDCSVLHVVDLEGKGELSYDRYDLIWGTTEDQLYENAMVYSGLYADGDKPDMEIFHKGDRYGLITGTVTKIEYGSPIYNYMTVECENYTFIVTESDEAIEEGDTVTFVVDIYYDYSKFAGDVIEYDMENVPSVYALDSYIW